MIMNVWSTAILMGEMWTFKWEVENLKGLRSCSKIPREDGGEIGGSAVHFPSMKVKYLADLRSRANSQQYSSVYEDRRPKIEDIERSDGKKST